VRARIVLVAVALSTLSGCGEDPVPEKPKVATLSSQAPASAKPDGLTVSFGQDVRKGLDKLPECEREAAAQ
jgi:hypothetical protein